MRTFSFKGEITALVKEKNTFQENYEQMKKHYEGEVLLMLTILHAVATDYEIMPKRFVGAMAIQVRHYQQLAGRREDELGVLRGEVSL